jgi:stalled ribosome alternative rescue factor ArfA
MTIVSENLKKILLDRATGKQVALDPLLKEVLDLYMTDLNSSSLREYITTWIAGYEPISGKLGRDACDPKTNKPKEIKPKSYTGKQKTNGGGCFNDYTRKRLEKDINDNLDIVHSLFIRERVVYVVEFSIEAVKEKLEKQIIEKCEKQKNSYVRSASWSYLDWYNHPSLKVHYMDRELISSFPDCMNGVLHKTMDGIYMFDNFSE